MSSTLTIQPLGGLGEIGLNCMTFEYAHEIIMIDCGLLFSNLEHFGVEFGIPCFDELLKKKDQFKGILMTHGHEDHIGALPFLIQQGIQAPIYASPFTALMVRERLKEHGLLSKVQLKVFQPGESFGFKHFQIQTLSVNHSIVDSVAFLIQTPVGKIIHTGDFKMDPAPFLGQTTQVDLFKKAGNEGVLLLMSDSTNVEKHHHNLEEQTVYQRFEELFVSAQGLIIVSMFSSNISRMGQIFELSKKLGKKIALAGRSIDQNVQLSLESGYLKDIESQVIPLEDLDRYSRKEVILLSTGSQGEGFSSLVRMSMGTHSQVEIQPGDLVLMSSRFIPGNEKAIGRMINQLFQQGASVLYEAVHEIHASGHATRPELKEMLEWTKPKFFIPIHGEYRHLVHHATLATETGIPSQNTVIALSGDRIQLTPTSCKIVEHQEATPVWVENRKGQTLSKKILKERRQLAELGVVFVILSRSSITGRILDHVDIVVKGLIHEEQEAKWLEKLKKHLRQWLQNNPDVRDSQEKIRVHVRQLLNHWIQKKPPVVVLITERR